MGIFSKNPRISFPVNMSPKVVEHFFYCTLFLVILFSFDKYLHFCFVHQILFMAGKS